MSAKFWFRCLSCFHKVYEPERFCGRCFPATARMARLAVVAVVRDPQGIFAARAARLCPERTSHRSGVTCQGCGVSL